MAENSILTPVQAETYPYFAQLLKDLFEHKICPKNFVTRSLDTQKREVYQEYQNAKKDYDSVKLIYDTLWDIIADNASQEEGLPKKLETAFISAELHESMKLYQENNQSESFRLFGVDFKQQEQLDCDVKLWAEEQLMCKLREHGIFLLKQLGQDVEGKNKELIVAKINQLPGLVSTKLEELDSIKESAEKNEKVLMEQYSKYTSILLESLKILEELIKKHLLEFQKEQYASKCESLEVQCDALLLKVKSLHLEILCETYTKETISALRKISKEMETKQEKIEKDITASKCQLHRYESVGQDFNSIVNEYSQLREAIKQKKWTLEKLKSYCP